jgi:hypothetical protein
MKRALLYLLPCLALAACETSKSADPLSPTVAGPIPGVNITAPTPVSPTSGTKIQIDQQPVTLVASNATSNGQRPLTYTFDVATDAGFSSIVFTRDSVAQGGNGQTTLRLPDPLATGRTYYWRARAQDGANTGPYSGAVNFDVFTPVAIEAPTIISPVKVVLTQDLHPVFTIRNAPRSGPVATPISYTIELSDSDAFINKLAVWTVPEQPNQTVVAAPQDLLSAHIYFWHARAVDANNTQGPWSATESFQTPAPRIEAPTPIFPALNVRVDSLRPRFLWQNSVRSEGGLGPITYTIELADNDSFTAKVAVWAVNETGSQTALDTPGDLQYAHVYYWRVRPNTATLIGGWSRVMAFSTPEPPPPPPPNTPPPPTGGGNWQSCGSTAGAALVQCVRDAIWRSSDDNLALVARVAWLLRGEGAGLLIKNGGDNIAPWNGYSFSTSRVCYPDGHIYKILTDAGPGGANGATWADNGFVDPKLYVPAMNPGS